MSDSQHLRDIVIPDIEISEGWSVSEISSLEDCEDAFAYLMAAVAEIEYQLEISELGVSVSPDPLWPANARRALKYKRAALQIVNQARGRLTDDAKRALQAERDRVLLDHIKGVTTDHQFQAWVIASGVEKLVRPKVSA